MLPRRTIYPNYSSTIIRSQKKTYSQSTLKQLVYAPSCRLPHHKHVYQTHVCLLLEILSQRMSCFNQLFHASSCNFILPSFFRLRRCLVLCIETNVCSILHDRVYISIYKIGVVKFALPPPPNDQKRTTC